MNIQDIIQDYEENNKLKNTPTPDQKSFYSRSVKGEGSDGSFKPFKVVVIRNLGGLNFASTKNALYYIMTNSESNKVVNEKGEEVEVSDVYNLWKKKFTNNLRSKEALHLVFSIDEEKNQKNYEALEKSVAASLRSNFYEYEYVYAIHKHQGKPHVHVILNKRSLFTNKKLHFKKKSDCKKFYDNLKNDFRDNLNYFNKNFNYKNIYRVDKKFSLDIVNKELKSINDRKYFWKIRLEDNAIEMAQNDKLIKATKLKIRSNFLEDDIPPPLNILNNLAEGKIDIASTVFAITSKLSLDKHYKKQLKRYTKKTKTIELKREKYLYLKEKFESNKVLKIEEALKYFNAPSQKKLLTLREKITLRGHLKSYKNLSNYFDNEFTNIIISKKNELDFLSAKLNSFEIHKLIRQCLKRKYINENISLSNNFSNIIKSNLSDLETLFIKRVDRVDILIKEFQRKNDVHDITEKEKGTNIKIIDFLEIERNFINKISINDTNLTLQKIDNIKFLKAFKIEVDKFTDKTSSYKIDKFLIECNHRILTANDSDAKDLLKTKNELRVMFHKRKEKNGKTIEYLNEIYDFKDKIEKEKIKESIKFFKKEIKFIDTIYKYEANPKAKETLIEEFISEVNNFNEKTSCYRIEKQEDKINLYLKMDSTPSSEKEKLHEIILYLCDMKEDRHSRNINTVEKLKKIFSVEKDKTKRSSLLYDLKTLGKEIQFIDRQVSIKNNGNMNNKDFER